MRRIVSIQGGMAGGKTTLAKLLEKEMKDVYFTYENPQPLIQIRKNKQLDLFSKEGFVENQRIFIEEEIKRYHNLPAGKVIFDRGPEDVEFYTIHFPIANGFDWDIEQLLKDELTALRKCRSDFIIYLNATEETLSQRKQKDLSRRRNSFTENMKLYQYEKEWFEQFNTIVVDVNEQTSEKVKEWTMNFLGEIKF